MNLLSQTAHPVLLCVLALVQEPGTTIAEKIGMTPAQLRDYNALRDKMRAVSERVYNKYQGPMVEVVKKYQVQILRLGMGNDPVTQVRRDALIKKMRSELDPLEKGAVKDLAPFRREMEAKLVKIFSPEQLAKLKVLLAEEAAKKEKK
ncbi:MAG: hypothetical protein ACOVT5_05650 [Armatimonadaceae bacterium]